MTHSRPVGRHAATAWLCTRYRAEELKHKIDKYGEVRDCYLPRDFHTGRPRGFGFVEFGGDRRDAEDAIRHLDGSDFRGRQITVCFSREVCRRRLLCRHSNP